jgi:hypothetical protein
MIMVVLRPDEFFLVREPNSSSIRTIEEFEHMSHKSGKKAVPKKSKEVRAKTPSSEEKWNPLSGAAMSEPMVVTAKKAEGRFKVGLVSLLVVGIGLIPAGTWNWSQHHGPAAHRVAAPIEGAAATNAKSLPASKVALPWPQMTQSPKPGEAATSAVGRPNIREAAVHKPKQSLVPKTSKTDKASVKGKTKSKKEFAAKVSPGKKAKDSDKKKLAKRGNTSKKLEAKVKDRKASMKNDKKTLAAKTND